LFATSLKPWLKVAAGAGAGVRGARVNTVARRVGKNGQVRKSARRLRKGDIVIVRAGEAIPATATSSKARPPWMNPPSPANPPRHPRKRRRPQRRHRRHARVSDEIKIRISDQSREGFSTA